MNITTPTPSPVYITDVVYNTATVDELAGIEELRKQLEEIKNDIADMILVGDFVAVSAHNISAETYLERSYKL